MKHVSLDSMINGREHVLGATLRIMSANLWSGAASPEGLVELVESLAVDVVACQELATRQAAALREVLPYGELQPSGSYHGMGIALRRPAELRRISLPYRDAWVALLAPEEWPGLEAPVEVINVHIAAPHASPTLSRPLWHRRGQMNGLRNYLDGSADEPGAATPARVLVGDFNATPAWPVYWQIASRLQDAARTAAKQNGHRVRRTWGPWHGFPRLLRIDHGFVDAARVDSFQVVDLPGSDHSAIVLDVAPSSGSG
jgi:endonuclease/exonuclease/phosphatase (EEP) superfamily protein YafD